MSHRIAYVMTRFPKVTETFILREMDELRAHHWEIEVFALKREQQAVSHPGADTFLAHAHFASQQPLATLASNMLAVLTRPVRYFSCLARTLWENWRSPAFLVRSLIAFPAAVYWGDIARRKQIEQIHAHFATHATYIAYVMSRMTGIPYSFTAHAHDIYVNRTMLGEKLHRASVVVTISDFNRRLLVNLYPEVTGKVSVIHCGIDTSQFDGASQQPQNAADGVLHIVCVGRLQELKGIIYLAQACRELKARHVPFACVLIGDGPERKKIEQYLAENDLLEQVSLVGWLPSTQVAEALAAAHVFVLPSVITQDGSMEGIPNVLMEAMSSQLPVVSTTISGIPELVTSKVHGFLVPPNDAVALADALTYLAEHPEERLAMGRAGRNRVRADFDLHVNVAAKAQLFASISSPTPILGARPTN